MIVDLEKRWMPRAACAGMPSNVFFYEGGTQPTPKERIAWRRAKEVCATCPVLTECGRDFLGEPIGVWGGMDPEERFRVRAEYSTWLRNTEADKKRPIAQFAAALRAGGMGMQDLARTIGTTQTAAAYLLDWLKDEEKSAEEPRKTKPDRKIKPLSKSHAKRAVAMRKDGSSVQEIARTLKISMVDIRAYLEVNHPELHKVNGMARKWPIMPPAHGDGWVRHHGKIAQARYLGETGDSQWVLVKARLSSEDTTAWFKAEDVKMLRPVKKNVLYRAANRPGGVYETRVSERPRSAKAAG